MNQEVSKTLRDVPGMQEAAQGVDVLTRPHVRLEEARSVIDRVAGEEGP